MFQSIHPIRNGAGATLLAVLLAAGTLHGCGGEGAGAGGAGAAGATQSLTDVASIQVLKSVPTLASAKDSTMNLTAVVKNAGNVGLKSQVVTFTTTDPGVRLEVLTDKTDPSGASTAKLTLSDSTNRAVPVTVVSGSVSVTENVAVAGTAATLVGPSSIALGATAEFSITLRDSASNPIAGQPVTVASQAGNAVAGAGPTNAQGQLRVTVTGSKSGSDTLTVTAMGATASAPFTVSGDQLSFIGTPAEASVNTVQTLKVKVLQGAAAQAGQTVSLNATRGTLSASSVITDVAGEASFTITSPTAGQTELIATTPGGLSSTSRFEFVSTTPAKVKLQPSPAVVGANLGTTTSNSSQLIAVVRDAADNPVKNRRVNFTFLADPSNGRIEPGSAVTDSSGTASVAFIAGPTPTGNNAVRIRSTVDGTAITDDTTLTVSRRELSVLIGTGNEIEKLDSTKNAVPYTAIVSDSSGNPVENVLVQASLVSVRYLKGAYRWSGSIWEKIPGQGAVCFNEDVNGNGQLDTDTGEDLATGGTGYGNGDGKLTPGNPAVVTFVTAGGKTNAGGNVDMKVTYPRDRSTWLEVRLRVTAAVVAGTEGVAEVSFVLPGLAADYTNQNVAPPGATSPYGAGSDCRNPN